MDDTLIWAENIDILKERITTVLDRCREFNVTISKKKFEIGEIIEFAGHMISATGIRPDDKKYDAIKNFPRPTDIKSLRALVVIHQ